MKDHSSGGRLFPFRLFVLVGLAVVYPRLSAYFSCPGPTRSIAGNFFPLEAQKWSESYPQIVMRSAVEVHFITDIKPQTDRPDPSLDASSGVKNGVHALRTKVIH